MMEALAGDSTWSHIPTPDVPQTTSKCDSLTSSSTAARQPLLAVAIVDALLVGFNQSQHTNQHQESTESNNQHPPSHVVQKSRRAREEDFFGFKKKQHFIDAFI